MGTERNNGCGCNQSKRVTGSPGGSVATSDWIMNVNHYGCVNPSCGYSMLSPYKYGTKFELSNYSCPLCNSEVKLLETTHLLK